MNCFEQPVAPGEIRLSMKGQEHYTLCIVVCTIYYYIIYYNYTNIIHAIDDSSSDIKTSITVT